MTILFSSSGRPYCSTDAKVQAVLPQLSEIRLVALTKQLARNRKQLYLEQGNAITELGRSKHHIDRERKLAYDRLSYISGPFKKSLFNVKGVQKCLERRKTDLMLVETPKMYGRYGGLEVKSLKGDIDVVMKEYSYQNVKMRRCKKLLADSKANGRIMNPNHCLPVLEAILNRPQMAMRRERALGFDSPSPTPSDEREAEEEPPRPPRTNFRLPPVTATRLYTPAKSKRGSPQKGAIAEVPHMERAYTVI
ncbi:uncharacterized protein LOC128209212 [Mya arenaria]|uniref:uncharacterized protein LOC128209212 n=1 Tax=Mya arenaria TaxID=6604 RepID=UPI0022E3A9E5|nr:uncharacterized protein LOC128209212 [Mya arenaria]